MTDALTTAEDASAVASSALADEVRALARLVDDPAPAVQRAVQARLDTLGRRALPHLSAAATEAGDAVARAHIREAAHAVHMDSLEAAWSLVLGAPNVDLERGAFLVALYRFPHLDIPAYQRQLDRMAGEARRRLSTTRGADRAFALADFMTETLRFEGNRAHFFDPNNSYLNQVIDRRRGIPISLSVVYLLLGQRLGLPVYGVDMPVRFLVKYEDEGSEIFLDLFDSSAPVEPSACVRFLMRAGITPRPDHFAPAAPQAILLRMVRNLLAIAQKAEQPQTEADLLRLLEPWDDAHAE